MSQLSEFQPHSFCNNISQLSSRAPLTVIPAKAWQLQLRSHHWPGVPVLSSFEVYTYICMLRFICFYQNFISFNLYPALVELLWSNISFKFGHAILNPHNFEPIHRKNAFYWLLLFFVIYGILELWRHRPPMRLTSAANAASPQINTSVTWAEFLGNGPTELRVIGILVH